jgi:uncharacterized repeat protein (TIGR01451 family)
MYIHTKNTAKRAMSLKSSIITLLMIFSSLNLFAQTWSENFNVKSANDFTMTGWTFPGDGSFSFSTSNTFNMTSRHIRSANIESGTVTTYTGYLWFEKGINYSVSFNHSCVCTNVSNNNSLPRVEVAYESFTTGQIVSTSGLFTTNQNQLNSSTSNFTPAQSGWYRVRFQLSRQAQSGIAAVAFDNITSNIPTNSPWNDTTVPMQQVVSISASDQVVDQGDQVTFTVQYSLLNPQSFTRARGAQFQINLPAGFTYNSHSITGSNYNNTLTTYNSNTGVFEVHTTNVPPTITLQIVATATQAQAGTFGSVYSSNNQPQNPTLSNFNPSPIQIIVNSTLPVELLHFTGKTEGRVNVLSWATSLEIDNDYFTVERSSNGLNFVEIARVDGKGNFSGRTDYAYADTKPLNGTAYYRLRQTDFDGTEKVYEAIRINRASDFNTAIKVLKNPSDRNQIVMNISAEPSAQWVLNLVDLNGRIIRTEKLNGTEVLNESYVLSGLNLNKGTYVIMVSNAVERVTAKVLVN